MNDSNQAISDDQELAKVLNGVQQQAQSMGAGEQQKHDEPSLQYEETPGPGAVNASPPPTAGASDKSKDSHTAAAKNESSLPSEPASNTADPALEGIKKAALEELRPLVEKLNLPAKEKFDTMLLIIRSTDDQSLLAPAHEAAKAIEDETERAEALLDVVKEIDYFAAQKAV